jgi:predicted nuclease with TOPRIM domain
MPHLHVEAGMKLPEQLPNDPDEIERLYNEYAQDVDDFNEAEFQRLMDARLAIWGIDPHQMTPDQIFGAMAESMNSMLLSLYAAKDEAPDDMAVEQVNEIIKMAEELRAQIDSAMHSANEQPAGE